MPDPNLVSGWRRWAPGGRLRRLLGPRLLLPLVPLLALVAASCGEAATVEVGADPAGGADSTAGGADSTAGGADDTAGGADSTAEGADSTAEGADDEAATSPDGPRLDPAVLSGEVSTVDGATFDLATVANKDLVVWFWAPW